MNPEYEQAWRDLRRRGWVTWWVSIAFGVAALLHTGPDRWTYSPFFYLWGLTGLLGAIWEFRFRCPRCGGRFLGRLTWRGTVCKHCDLPQPKDPARWPYFLALLGAGLGGVAEYLYMSPVRIGALGPRPDGPAPRSWWLPGAFAGALIGLGLALVLRRVRQQGSAGQPRREH